jgi:hypothetical protein
LRCGPRPDKKEKEKKEMKMMFEEFVKEMAAKVKEFLPESFGDADVSVQVVTKNNDLKLTGITVKSIATNVAPTIYMENFFQRYEDGEALDALARGAADACVRGALSNDFDTTMFTDFGKCRDKIVPRLVSAEMNGERLKGIPHDMVADLAVTYHVQLDDFEGGKASVTVTNEIMERWGVSQAEVHAAAMENLPVVSPGRCVGMLQVLEELMPGLGEFDGAGEADEQMYVLTNESRTFGAASILDEKLMENVVNRIGDGFYVLPSSVHELLAIPADGGMNAEFLEGMVRDVNETQVAADERLSDGVYRYFAGKGLVRA